MYQSDWTMLSHYIAEHWQSDRVVSSDGDESTISIVALNLFSLSLNLPHGVVDAEGRDCHVAGINNLDLLEWGNVEFYVKSRPQMTRRLAHFHRTEPGARTERRTSIERDAEDGHVVVTDAINLGKSGECGCSGITRNLGSTDGADNWGIAAHDMFSFAVRLRV